MGRGLDRGRRAVREAGAPAVDAESVGSLLAVAECAPGASSASCGDVVAALRLVPTAQQELDRAEVRLIEALQDAGWSLDEIAAAAYGGISRQALHARYVRIGGQRKGKPGRRPSVASHHV